MWKTKWMYKIRIAMLTACMMVGGTMFSGCGLTDIRDNLVSGALGAIEGASENFVGSLIIDFNEWIESVPDAPLVDTP
jgi:hypothetical protein